MATNPLVEQVVDRDLPALIALALEKHHLPVSARFWMHSPTGQWQIVVISDLVDRMGTREAYRSVFGALDQETFSTKTFLASHILLVGEEETREVQEQIKNGVTRLPFLGPFEDVDVYLVPDAEKIQKQGFLRFLLEDDQSVRVTFGALGGGGALKPAHIPFNDVERFLAAFSCNDEAENEKLLNSLLQKRTASVLIQTTLRELYAAGLI